MITVITTTVNMSFLTKTLINCNEASEVDSLRYCTGTVNRSHSRHPDFQPFRVRCVVASK